MTDDRNRLERAVDELLDAFKEIGARTESWTPAPGDTLAIMVQLCDHLNVGNFKHVVADKSFYVGVVISELPEEAQEQRFSPPGAAPELTPIERQVRDMMNRMTLTPDPED